MIEVFLIILLIVYPVLEGFRETHFYHINRAANFSLKEDDVILKRINVLTFLSFVVAAVFILESVAIFKILLIFTMAFYRWVILDGILNINRSLGFWYAGNSGRSFTDKILYPLPILLRSIVKILPLIVFLTLYFYLKYWV